MRRAILCVGEVLWDALPAGLFLGGAPFNVACHLRQLGEDAAIVSRVGDDVLGREALRRLRHRGLSDDGVQVDETLRTGFVEVELDAEGSPGYTIIEPVAWDAIALTEAVQGQARQAQALVYGSLAQRREPSRTTIRTLWEAPATKVFDVNLRPPFVKRSIVEASLKAADIVKMNDEELETMRAWFDLPARPKAAVEALTEQFGNAAVCVTRGAAGAMLWNGGRWSEHPGYRVTVADTVGAGDAFLAALLAGYFTQRDDRAVLDEAARLGAFVATQFGGTPSYEIEALDEISAMRLDAPSG